MLEGLKMSREKKQTILIVNGSSESSNALDETLMELDYDVSFTKNEKFVIESARKKTPDLIILNISAGNSYEAFHRLKQDTFTRDIPIIIMNSPSQIDKTKAFEYGAVDCISQTMKTEEIHARLKVHLELHSKVKELENFNSVMVDREMRIIELKKEVNRLAKELDKPLPYPEIWEEKCIRR